jgi:hypothetical protein
VRPDRRTLLKQKACKDSGQKGRVGRTGHRPWEPHCEGEEHGCVHLAIDRFTGQIIDRQVELVKE